MWDKKHSLVALRRFLLFFKFRLIDPPSVDSLKLPRSDGENEILPFRGGGSPSTGTWESAKKNMGVLLMCHEHRSSTGKLFAAIRHVPSPTLLMDMHLLNVRRAHSHAHWLLSALSSRGEIWGSFVPAYSRNPAVHAPNCPPTRRTTLMGMTLGTRRVG